jgi:hypothetical protein
MARTKPVPLLSRQLTVEAWPYDGCHLKSELEDPGLG